MKLKDRAFDEISEMDQEQYFSEESLRQFQEEEDDLDIDQMMSEVFGGGKNEWRRSTGDYSYEIDDIF